MPIADKKYNTTTPDRKLTLSAKWSRRDIRNYTVVKCLQVAGFGDRPEEVPRTDMTGDTKVD